MYHPNLEYISHDDVVQFKIEGHLVVEAPAAPQNSITLLTRAIRIHQANPGCRIGVFCFNAVQRNNLRTQLAALSHPNPAPAAIDVYDVYSWVKQIGLASRHLSFMVDDETLYAKLKAANWSFEVGYDAVLVDQGQDATSTQIEVYKALCDGGASSFTIFFDERQSLYGTENLLGLLESHGFDIRHPKRIDQSPSALSRAAIAFFDRINMDVSTPVFPTGSIATTSSWSTRIADVFLKAKLLSRFALAALKKQLRHHSKHAAAASLQIRDRLELVQVNDAQALLESAIARIHSLVAASCSFGDIAILIPSRKYSPDVAHDRFDGFRQSICRALEASDIPFTYFHCSDGYTFDDGVLPNPGDNRRTADLRHEGVKVMTIHASKGYHARFVIIAGFDGIDGWPTRAPLGHVALTRATEKCVAYFASVNESVDALKSVLSE